MERDANTQEHIYNMENDKTKINPNVGFVVPIKKYFPGKKILSGFWKELFRKKNLPPHSTIVDSIEQYVNFYGEIIISEVREGVPCSYMHNHWNLFYNERQRFQNNAENNEKEIFYKYSDIFKKSENIFKPISKYSLI